MLGKGNAMKPRISLFFLFVVALAPILFSSDGLPTISDSQYLSPKRTYLGFDRNMYPGDAGMKALRHDFAFTSYWLSAPPGEKVSAWHGKREFIHSLGYGFVVLYNGRGQREIKNAKIAASLGEGDAHVTAAAAKLEGFPANTIVFLDIEEGGLLSPAYHLYLQSWLWTLTQLDYQGGFYCSGIPVREDAQTTITTADDITDFLALKSRPFTIWAFNDVCPPSPGCVFPEKAPSPQLSGNPNANIWQYAQSPRRMERTVHCAPGYRTDGNCYAPADTAHVWFLDVNSATSPDPSNGAGASK